MANKIWVGTDTGNEGDLNVAANWSPSGVPAATDSVRFPAGSNAITDSVTALNTSTLSGSLATVVFEDGFSAAVASSAAAMQFTCTRFDYSGTGQAFIDLEASAIGPRIYKTGSATTGQRSLCLKGSALTTLDIESGNVGIAFLPFETATVATIRVNGTNVDLVIGAGVTLTTLLQSAGTVVQRCAATTVTAYAGTLTTLETGAITTINSRGANIFPNSTGTITTLNLLAGFVDFTKSGAARTVTTFAPTFGIIKYDPAVVTLSAISAVPYQTLVNYSLGT